MDINIQDEHYNKYIKYKHKYLELKEQSGGVLNWRRMFSWLFTNKSENKSKNKSENESKNEILNLENKLLIHLLPNLYYNNNNNNFILIYINICNIIINYCEYFYINDLTNEKLIPKFKNNNKDNIKKAQYQIRKISKELSEELSKKLEIYFNLVNNCIKNNYSSISKKNNFNINNNNFVRIVTTNIDNNIKGIFANSEISEENFNSIKKNLGNIENLLKLQVLITNNNNNINDNIMLIKCFFIYIILKISKEKKVNINYDNYLYYIDDDYKGGDNGDNYIDLLSTLLDIIYFYTDDNQQKKIVYHLIKFNILYQMI